MITNIQLCSTARVDDRPTVIWMNTKVIPNLNNESDVWVDMMDKCPQVTKDAKEAIAEIQSAITTWKKRLLKHRMAAK